MRYFIAALFITCLCITVPNIASAKTRTDAKSKSEKITSPKPHEEDDFSREEGEENDNPGAREQFEQQRLQDPATGKIPAYIHQKELQFASHIPTRAQEMASSSYKTSGAQTQATTWSLRGPYNIGGRTRALGIDASNQNIIIAGGISGGAWRSTDKGATWVRTTPLSTMPSVSCLAQDTRSGKTNIWYYGTGEISGNSEGYPLQDYPGNGIFKSTDDGITWNVLPSTHDNSVVFDQAFDYVYEIAIDPSATSQDIVYAATIYGIERSTDGGTTWALTLRGQGQSTFLSDVVVTSTGVAYASIDNNGAGNIYRSTDGLNWTDITPTGWQTGAQDISIGLAPSNQKVLYFLLNAYDASFGVETYNFWKYTYGSGDGSGTGGTWEDRSANVPQDYGSYGGYAQYVKVKPDQENVVFFGGVELYRTTDGLATANNVSVITSNMHVDQHSMAFFKSNPASMIVGNDGGVFLTNSNTAATVYWNSLDNGYYTTQFYSVAIDPTTPGNNIVIGGMQDNSTFFSGSTDVTRPWSFMLGGDGTSCAISSGRSSYYVSYQNGDTYREIVDDNGNIISYGRIDPPNTTGYLWVNPMVLDPNNTDRMYFGGMIDVWRNDDMTQIPLGSDQQATQGWVELTNATATSGSVSALAISTTPANRLYYGTGYGQLYRLNNANTNTSAPTNIFTGAGFPAGGYINCIAVDSKNADNAIVVFSNYNVQSLFYTSNGGTTWTPIGGNLEENPDGSGNGPSCRWASIVHVGNSVMYLVGTSTGLYSTSYLNGTSTVWALEGASTIGNNIVAMMNVRESDGLVAVASHGAGIYTGNITSVTPVPSAPLLTFPTDGSVNIPQKTIMQWNSDPGELYTVQVATDLAFTNIVYQHALVQGGGSTTSDTATGLSGQTKYYWRVQGANSGGVSPFSSAWNFTTVLAIPPSPTLLYPSTGATSISIKPALRWAGAHGAATYHLQMSLSYSFSSPFLDDSLVTDTAYVPPALAISTHYYWRVSASNVVGQSSYSPTWVFTTGTNSVNDGKAVPQTFSLEQNFPNPFTASTSFNYTIADEGMTTLKVYDILGKEITTLFSGRLSPGTYNAEWNAGDLPHGVYFYRLQSGTFTATKQMMLMK